MAGGQFSKARPVKLIEDRRCEIVWSWAMQKPADGKSGSNGCLDAVPELEGSQRVETECGEWPIQLDQLRGTLSTAETWSHKNDMTAARR